MTPYVTWLRRFIGHAKTPLVYASTIIADPPGAILFQRRADFGDAWWGLPGGLLELGESIAAAAVREAREETGLIVHPARLAGLYTSPDFDVTYPNGDEVQQITACFECHVIGGDLRPQADEIIELRYFAPDALPPMPPWYAAMIDDFLARHPEASFRSGAPGSHGPPANATYPAIRRAIGGHDRLIVVGASAMIRHENEVLLQRRGDTGAWGLPGGSMELGERIDQVAVREVREETGLDVEPLKLVGLYSDPQWMHTYPDGNAVQVVIAHFDCRVIGGALKRDGVETLDLHYFPIDALPADVPDRWRVRIEDTLAGQPEAFVR